ncbi:MAG: NADH-quinone oxidoreductase subunit J, partial [Bdellovibrio bacteriovorus]
ASLLLGLLPAWAFDLIAVGRVPSAEPIAAAWAGALSWSSLGAGLLPVLLVATLVLILGPWGEVRRSGPLGWPARAAAALADSITRLDGGLRRWPVAGLSLLALVLTFAVGLVVGS